MVSYEVLSEIMDFPQSCEVGHVQVDIFFVLKLEGFQVGIQILN